MCTCTVFKGVRQRIVLERVLRWTHGKIEPAISFLMLISCQRIYFTWVGINWHWKYSQSCREKNLDVRSMVISLSSRSALMTFVDNKAFFILSLVDKKKGPRVSCHAIAPWSKIRNRFQVCQLEYCSYTYGQLQSICVVRLCRISLTSWKCPFFVADCTVHF